MRGPKHSLRTIGLSALVVIMVFWSTVFWLLGRAFEHEPNWTWHVGGLGCLVSLIAVATYLNSPRFRRWINPFLARNGLPHSDW